MRDRQATASSAGEPVLQLRPPPEEVTRRRLWGSRYGRTRPQRRFSVLLVDDDNHHGIPLLCALRDQKHTVLYASDGASGENLFRTWQLEIDALVARADMNRMCGFELARRLRRVRPEIRVLLMCRRFARFEEAHRAREHGYGLIEEPFTPEELCRRLTGLLASPRDVSCAEPQLEGEERLILREFQSTPSIPRRKTEPWLPGGCINGTE